MAVAEVSFPTISVDNPADSLAGLLTFDQVAEGYRVTNATIFRWATRGIPGRNGERHKLACFRIGARKYVRQSDLAAFLAAINA